MSIGGDLVTETILLLRRVSHFDLVPVMRLTFGLQFAPLRTTIYWVMCKCLETIDHIADAVDCFHDLESQPEGETNLRDEQRAVGELSSHILDT